ncbi:MAG TPA: hypothetical protein GXX75_20435 [Clostridiales bacterium]|nr:hypothetical protein [Clostridiales bacterium]
MNIELNISERDKKLLLILLSLLILAGAYFLVYQKNMKQVQEVSAANEELRTRVEELSQMQAQADTKQAEMKEFSREIAEIEAKFPLTVSQADAIVTLDELERAAGMKISSSGFNMNQRFYLSGLADPEAGAGTEQTPAADRLQGFKSTVTISYQTTYEGLKQAIDYINGNQDRMTIGDLSVTYDTSTGNLMGSMTIHMYSILVPDTDKTYEPPALDRIGTGRDNIFGTIE